MELRDLIVTPFIIIAVYTAAYFLRPRLCDVNNYRYFFPALTTKLLGALFVGVLYQYYYNGGDTFNYHTHGSRVIWDAFMDSPESGLKLIFTPSAHNIYKYSSRMLFFGDPSSYFVVQVAAVIDLLTFSTYSATAVVFAFFSFLGMWFMFLTFYESYPHLKGKLALCVLFIPSVVVWGSGLLKDTLVIGSIGFATYAIKAIFVDRRVSIAAILMFVISLLIIFQVKKYVLLCFLPSAIFWVYGGNLQQVRSRVLRIMLLPVVIVITVLTGLFVTVKVGQNDRRYALDKIAETASITAYDIGFYTGRNAGSRYALGKLDGSFGSMVALFPQAVNVSLFRPYIWEVRNPLMLLSAIESFALLITTLFLLFRRPLAFFAALRNPTIIFCLMFSITFAFAVGVSTFNFGTLSRYKIPLTPFYLVALVIIADSENKARKLAVFERTE
ncbi:MAG TPA: hypothetical protein VFE50_02530 [Cyclobacteriaceae bacterium]|nr:hypothetical protein [Cyclobacteriaceae bacterium]